MLAYPLMPSAEAIEFYRQIEHPQHYSELPVSVIHSMQNWGTGIQTTSSNQGLRAS